MAKVMGRIGRVFCAVVGVGVTASAFAFAAASHTVPASGCHDFSGAATYGTAGRIRNLVGGGTIVEVVCPLQRDNITNTTGLSGAKAYLHRDAADSVNKIHCDMYSTTNVSGAGLIISSDSNDIDGTGDIVMDFGASSTWDTHNSGTTYSINTTGNNAGMYAVFCRLPDNGDGLYGFSWSEP